MHFQSIKFILFLLVFHLFGMLVSAQSKEISITGTVYLDSIPSQDAVVTLTSLEKSVITNQKGVYKFSDLSILENIKILQIQASFLGFIKNSIQFNLEENNSSYNVDIYLESDAQDLDEVIIVNQRTRVKKSVNKLSYSVRKGDYIANTEGSTVLNSVPSLSYDKSAGVKIDGNRNALIFVDGIEMSSTELNAIDAKRIKIVEVVSNPSAKFGSEFSGGIINVILRETDSIYYKGSIELGKGLLRESTSVNPNLSIKTNRLNVNGTYFYSENKQEVQFDVIRNPQQSNFYEQSSFRQPEVIQSSADINIRYSLGERDFIYLKGGYVLNEEKGLIKGTFSDNNVENSEFSNDSENSYNQVTLDGVFEKKIGKNLLSIRSRYTTYDKENIFSLIEGTGETQAIETRSNFKEISGLADFEISEPKFLGESSQINVGVKYIDRNYNFSDDDFFLDQKILASYVDSSFPITKSISSFVSIYMEGVENSNVNFSEKDFFFLPSASTNFALNKQASIELSYARRISRPNAYDLNETEILLNPGIAERGNKNLQPEIRNYSSIRFSYSFKNNSYLSLRPFYESFDDAILQELIRDEDILFYSKSNIGSVRKYGISLGYNKTFFKKIRTNLSLGYRNNKFDNKEFENTGGTVYGSLFASTSVLKDKLDITFFSSWDTPKYTFISETRQNPFTSLSLRTNLFKNKISTSLTYNDIFRWASDITTSINQGVINQTTDINSRFSNILIKLRYNFGDSFNSGNRIKTLRNSDIQN